MQERILQYIMENQLIEEKDFVIIGVSGGADSICLFHVLHNLRATLGFEIAVVHINHCLRGEESQGDEDFVRDLCERFGVQYQGVSIDIQKEAKERKMTIEEAGRAARRETFERFARVFRANKIALGQHADDQAETVLFNLVRGSAVSGLCGIRPQRGEYIRPLLCVNKSDIEKYLTDNQLEWRVDQSNLEQEYTRNKIRHTVLKYLQDEINPKVNEHIAMTAMHLQEVEEYLQGQSKKAFHKYANLTKDEIFIDGHLVKEDLIIQKYVMRLAMNKYRGSLKNLSKVNLEQMVNIFNKEVGKSIHLLNGLKLERTYEGAVLVAQEEPEKKTISTDISVVIPGQWIVAGEKYTSRIINAEEIAAEEVMCEKVNCKYFDNEKIKGDLVMRTRKRGDVIATCADGGKKKLKDYFIDAKIPREERDGLLLLATDSEVLWIVGDRISEKYKVTLQTKQILMINKEGKE